MWEARNGPERVPGADFPPTGPKPGFQPQFGGLYYPENLWKPASNGTHLTSVALLSTLFWRKYEIPIRVGDLGGGLHVPNRARAELEMGSHPLRRLGNQWLFPGTKFGHRRPYSRGFRCHLRPFRRPVHDRKSAA